MNWTRKLSFCLLLLSSGVRSQDSTRYIGLNQEGFYPNAPKIAVRITPEDNNIFYIIRKNIPDTVFRGFLTSSRHSMNSSRLEPPYAGRWARSAGHPDNAVIIHPSAASAERKSGSLISTTGGCAYASSEIAINWNAPLV